MNLLKTDRLTLAPKRTFGRNGGRRGKMIVRSGKFEILVKLKKHGGK